MRTHSELHIYLIYPAQKPAEAGAVIVIGLQRRKPRLMHLRDFSEATDHSGLSDSRGHTVNHHPTSFTLNLAFV